MPLDGVSINCLTTELDQTLANSRVDRIHQPDRHDLIFQLRHDGQNSRLLLSANPATPRIHLTDDATDNPGAPPMFCMLLRKHLSGARLTGITNPDYERILDFTFQTVNDLGDTVIKTLTVELMGRHSNIILLNEDGYIHDAIVHVDASISRVREIMPARRYSRPPAQNKQPPDLVLAKLQSEPSLFPDALASRTLSQALLAWIQGFSPQLCQEVVYRSGLDDRFRVGELTELQRRLLRQALLDILTQITEKQYQPSIFLRQPTDQVPIDFHALPLRSFAYRQSVPTLSQAMDRFYTDQTRQNQLKQKRAVLVKRVQRALEPVQNKRAIHQDNIRAAADCESIQKMGNLILANLARWTDGSSVLEAIDYYDPEQSLIRIPIDPGLTAPQMAQRYFKNYARVKKSGEISQKLLRKDNQEIEWLESLLHELDEADSLEALSAVADEMNQEGLDRAHDSGSGKSASQSAVNANRLNPGKAGSRARRHQKNLAAAKPTKGRSKKSDNSKRLPPRQYTSTDGLTILVGRNNLQNDTLTLRTAAKDDWWFHVQKMPGSHVIVRAQQQPVPDRTIEEAAALAAWFSRATASLQDQSPAGLKVPVDYCLVSHVRKPRGAKPGMVIYDRYQTILVTPKEL